MSVRDIEKLVKNDNKSTQTKRNSKNSAGAKDPDTLQLEQELASILGMGVTIDHASGQEGGALTLRYRSLEQLDDLLRVLGGN